jgi:hypothetical protein
MHGWQVRARAMKERDELNTRLYMLGAFIAAKEFDTLPVRDQVLLMLQHRHMSSYRNVLNERIRRFSEKDAQHALD